MKIYSIIVTLSREIKPSIFEYLSPSIRGFNSGFYIVVDVPYLFYQRGEIYWLFHVDEPSPISIEINLDERVVTEKQEKRMRSIAGFSMKYNESTIWLPPLYVKTMRKKWSRFTLPEERAGTSLFRHLSFYFLLLL